MLCCSIRCSILSEYGIICCWKQSKKASEMAKAQHGKTEALVRAAVGRRRRSCRRARPPPAAGWLAPGLAAATAPGPRPVEPPAAAEECLPTARPPALHAHPGHFTACCTLLPTHLVISYQTRQDPAALLIARHLWIAFLINHSRVRC